MPLQLRACVLQALSRATLLAYYVLVLALLRSSISRTASSSSTTTPLRLQPRLFFSTAALFFAARLDRVSSSSSKLITLAPPSTADLADHRALVALILKKNWFWFCGSDRGWRQAQLGVLKLRTSWGGK